MRELERRSEGYFSMTAALLYPALHPPIPVGVAAPVRVAVRPRHRGA
jgi:hypothetical protein